MGKLELAGQQVLPATPAEVAQYHANYGWEVASLHGESSRLLNVNGNPFGDPPQVGYPSRYMPLPPTDAALVAMGWPSILGAVDGDLWLCDEAAGNLVGEINGYQLAPQNAPLQNRDFHGLAYGGSLWAKKAVECLGNLGNERFVAAAGAGVLDVGAGVDFTISLLLRPRSLILGTQIFIRKFNAAIGWDIYATAATGQPTFRMTDAGGGTQWILPVNIYDGALHLATVSIDRDGNVSWYFDGAATVAAAAARPGDLTNNDTFTLLNYSPGGFSFGGQCAWVMVNIGVAASRVGHDALWNCMQLPRPYAYGMANPLVAPIAASRVACWAGGNTPQVPVGYHANLVSAARGNALGTGYVCEDGATFLGIQSANISTFGAGGWSRNGATIFTATDGASGMRDGQRITMGGAWAVGVQSTYGPSAPSPGATLAGATNVSFLMGVMAKQATVGTTLRGGMYITGDAGGPETFTLISSGSTTANFAKYIGTATPVRVAHTNAYAQLGAAVLNDNVDCCEVYLIQNRAVDVLAWRRVGEPAAAGTSTPTYQLTNTANRYYNPLRGQIRLVIGGFQLTDGAVFLQFGAAAAAGSLTLDYNAGQLRLRIWDATPALAATVLCGALDATEWRLVISYDSTTPVRDGGNANVVVERINPGAPTTWLGASWGAWTAPTAAVLALYFGSAAGANAARCYLAEA